MTLELQMLCLFTHVGTAPAPVVRSPAVLRLPPFTHILLWCGVLWCGVVWCAVLCVAGKPFNSLTKGKALAGLAHSLSMSELSMSEQIRLALNTIGAMDFGRVSGAGGGGGGGGCLTVFGVGVVVGAAVQAVAAASLLRGE
jgi:hypothetical protein